MKLFTEVSCEKKATIARTDSVCVLGSCFADEMGMRMADAGFDVIRNPFGTLYNPASIASAVERLDSVAPFTPQDCVEMGAGAGLVCSFSHHTSFARPTPEEFLAHANARLSEDAARWRACTHVILTLGTAWVWRALGRPGRPVVANCLKRPAQEFAHELLSVDACAALLRGIIEAHPEKRFILTVSPIRHLGADAHANTVSKSTLHLAVERICHPGPSPSFAGLTGESPRITYFPAYEIVMDELRDYRFYADDLVHPAPAAVQLVWERFLDACTDPADRPAILAAERAARAARHRPLR